MRFIVLAAFLLCAAPAPDAFAAAKDAKDAKQDGAARNIEVLNLALPVARQGRLVNYLFVSIELTPGPGQDLWKLREQTHFLRDAYIKLSHAEDLSDPSDPRKLDTARARARLLAATESVLGRGVIAQLAFTSVDSQRLDLRPGS